MNYRHALRRTLVGGSLLVAGMAGASVHAQVARATPQSAESPPPPKFSLPRPAEYKGADWSIRLRALLVYDAGYTENPNGALASDQLGADLRRRALRLGVQGRVQGDLGYKAEVDVFARTTEWGDVYLDWTPTKQLSVKVGQQNSFQSVDQTTSTFNVLFMERPQFVEAYGQTRRLGATAAWSNGQLFAGAGLLSGSLNKGVKAVDWLAAARGVVMPRVGGTQLHFGANFQHRAYNADALGTRYRARPNPRLTNIRFVDTGELAVSSDDQLGLEAIAIRGPLHLIGEASWLWSRTATRPLANEWPLGLVVPDGNASFFGYYLEAGYILTGETRGYSRSKAVWDQTPVANPVGKGGFGSLSANIRWDRMDLTDPALLSGGWNTRSSRGGNSKALSFNLAWQPVDQIRITGQYTRLQVTGGPYALQANGLTQGDATDHGFHANVVGGRFAYDF